MAARSSRPETPPLKIAYHDYAMTSRRVLKVAEAIREVVSMSILIDLRDPRIQDVTVTYVEVASDLRTAKVHVSVMGDEKKQKLSMSGLQHSAGFLQQKIGNRLDTRYIPRLQFVLDKGVKHSIEMAKILNEVLPKELAESDAKRADAESGADTDPNALEVEEQLEPGTHEAAGAESAGAEAATVDPAAEEASADSDDANRKPSDPGGAAAGGPERGESSDSH